MQAKIKKLISDVLISKEWGAVDFAVDYPQDLNFGDYSSNVAMILSKKNGQDARDIGQSICDELQKFQDKDFSKIEIAGPGFINFYLSNHYLSGLMKFINIKGDFYGQSNLLKGKQIVMDHTDPNVMKPFHIGHLMSNIIGEFIGRIYQFNGAKVTQFTYQGDVGLHIAKTLWGMKKMSDSFPDETVSLSRRMQFIGQAYVTGEKAYNDDVIAKNEIIEINKKVYLLFDDTQVNDDPDIQRFYLAGKKWSLQHFEEIYFMLGSVFEKYLFESQTFDLGQKIVRENVGKVFELSEGAIIYRGEQDGLHTRVFINKEGLPTYEAKDLGLVYLKKELVPDYMASIIITASEQKEYFRVLKTALRKIDPESAQKMVHIPHGMLRFSEGKMSSRLGNVITGESMIHDLRAMIGEKVADRGYDEYETEEIKTVVGIGAIKFTILRQAIGKDIIYDPAKSISFEGDSGPYLQYSYARAHSVLEKAKKAGIKFSDTSLPQDENTVGEIERLLSRFPEIIEKSLKELAPQHVSSYLLTLASAFNKYYAETKIIDHSPEVAYKLNLVRATMTVIKNGLFVLGIKVSERM